MRSTPSTEIVLRSVCPRATLFKGIPSSSTSTCAGEEPRMLGCASSPSPPYARTDNSATVRTASATVRAPDRSISSREITVTEAGVDVAGWGRFPGTMTSGSSNVGGCTGTGSGVCAITACTGRMTSITVITPVNKNTRSEEHTSELQSRLHLVCRLLLEKKKNTQINKHWAQTVASL